ncbi:bile acid:sodium symporter family protein [Alteribacillus sp. HJP-4]|uniref:bile acid:sodium symporter family protein n=1 Tax=Alteribacillus sp. HJP-4 TaxID=2775394 RepID=UPI0035CD2428
MLTALNYCLEKVLPYAIPIIVLLGVTILNGAEALSPLVKWIFAFISFSSCLNLNLTQLKKAFTSPLPIIASMIILQVFIPAVAYVAGLAFFSDDIYLITGLVLAFTIPTGVITIMWTGIFGGNTGITLAVVLLNTLVSPLLVPLTLNILVGAQVAMDVWGLITGLLWMVVVPSLLGIIVNRIIDGRSKKFGASLAPFSKIGVLTVILINSAVVSPYFQSINGRLIFLFLLVACIACFAYVVGFSTARVLKWEKSTSVSLMYTSGMRNTGVGATLAITYFPAAAALPVVLAIIFQQVLAVLAGKYVQYYFMNKDEKEEDFRFNQ